MDSLFRWFYCLDIPVAVVLILLATAAFHMLRSKFGMLPRWKPAMAALFLLWLGVILLGTLGNRSGTPVSAPQLDPFYSYRLAFTEGHRELYRENFMNAVLFYPAGLLGCAAAPDRRHRGLTVFLLIFLLLTSIGIEYCQYRFALGLVETDDVIHNMLGVWLGTLAAHIQIKNQQPV